MRYLCTGFLVLFGLQVGSAGLGRDLAPGLQLIYASNDQEQPAWVIDSVIAGMALLPQGDCAQFYLRRQPDQARAEENRACIVGDTLFIWDPRRATWQPRRPVGPGMTLNFPQANGDTIRYTTGAPAEEVISGRRLVVIPTIVLTVDTLGRPKRRLRERFALGLVTATGGVFERPDSGIAGWRVEQTFELRAIHSGSRPPPPSGRMSIPTPDGEAIEADLYGAGASSVVLVAHGGYSFKARWEKQARAMADAGFHVVVFDTRAAVALRAGKETACLYDAGCMAVDVLAVVRHLRKLGSKAIAVVGGSAGGGAVAQASVEAAPGEIDRLVLLAPMSIAAPEKMKGNKLIITSRDDRSDAGLRLPDIRDQYRKAPKPKKLVILEGSAHGQLIFDTPQGEPLMGEILKFLSGGQERPARAHAALDHLILGINSLESGMKAFAALTGIVPVRGGVHPGAGTENALVSLGEGAYLELIAPRPGATPTSFAIISSLDRLTPIGWALRTDSLSVLVEQLRKTDSVLGPFPGSRQTPDGKLLTWKTAHVATPGLEPAPFLIEWGPSSVHPSSTSPSGCQLTKLIVTEPAPARMNAFFKVLGLELVVQASPTRRLAFTLRCPGGEIAFSN